jgi:CheY-like chemotaxis protein
MLAPIIGYTDMTLEQLEPSHPLHKYQTRIAQAARRASDLVRQILTFSRQSEQERQPVDLMPHVKELLKLMRASLPSTIQIRTRVAKDLGTVLADPTEMHQVLMNLTANAAHAMRENGGVLELQLDPCEVDAELARSLPGLAPGPHLLITVRDSGCGMDEQTLGRVFEPFFTTKPKEEGTGLGLSVVHGIVTSHAGAITVESTPGRGTTFRIYLPRHTAAAEAITEHEEPIRGGTERILLVDDERGIAEYGRVALLRLGYKVHALDSSREALQVFRRQPDSFDLVLTDLTMPLLTGLQLADAVRALRPRLPVVLMTGSSDASVARAEKEGRISAVIEKPSGLRRLAAVLRACLDEGQRAPPLP